MSTDSGLGKKTIFGTVADADLEISGVCGGGGGEGSHPDPEIRGTPGLKKNFSALRASGIIVMTEVRGAGFS